MQEIWNPWSFAEYASSFHGLYFQVVKFYACLHLGSLSRWVALNIALDTPGVHHAAPDLLGPLETAPNLHAPMTTKLFKCQSPPPFSSGFRIGYFSRLIPVRMVRVVNASCKCSAATANDAEKLRAIATATVPNIVRYHVDSALNKNVHYYSNNLGRVINFWFRFTSCTS